MSLPRINWSNDGTLLYELDHANIKTAFIQNSKDILDGDLYKSDTIGKLNATTTYSLLYNFPDTITINKIGFKISNPSSWEGEQWSLWASADSTDGVDGEWIEVYTFARPSTYTYIEHTVDIQNVKWLKGPIVNSSQTWYNFSIFGEYTEPNFELYDANGTSKLNTENLFSETTTISNVVDYSDRKQFKIKNTTDTEHSYTVSIEPLKYGGDLIITNYFSLSSDNGTTKSQTVVTSTVAPGELCEEVIDIWIDLLAVDNTGDGWHYFSINVVEN
jgi:hypothetical protein